MADKIDSKQRLSDRVAAALQDDILSRSPGDRMPTEAELTERFNVSRTVIREATRLLAQRGLVDIKPGRGMRVATVDGSIIAEQYGFLLRLSEGTFDELMELRLVLEIEMAALAAARRSDEQLAELSSLNEQLKSSEPGSPEFLEADLAFHEKVAESSRNSFFPLVIRPLNDFLSDTYTASSGYPSESDHTISEHVEIANAIAQSDPARARFAAENHLRRIIAARALLAPPATETPD